MTAVQVYMDEVEASIRLHEDNMWIDGYNNAPSSRDIWPTSKPSPIGKVLL